MSSEDEDRARLVATRIFQLFDADGSGACDFTELCTGLTVLCGGSKEQKSSVALALYDYNQDGVISLDELSRYLFCVFRVAYEVVPGCVERHGGHTARELAEITAKQVFSDFDHDDNGVLTYSEFMEWASA